MAANDLFDTGIKVTGSFSAAGAFPVDGKSVVETIEERNDHVTQNRAYQGMIVYVKEDGKTYQYNGTDWEEFGFNEGKFEESVYDGLDSESASLALSAKQGKVLNDKIDDHIEDNTLHVTFEEKRTWNSKANAVHATNSMDGLMSATDKLKLDTIEVKANNYEHPDTHPATMIVEDEEHRFVTDEQINAWDNKKSTKEEIGLGNVTNDAQVKRSEMGVSGGVATLDDNGKVPSTQLPSYVDDVVEYENKSLFPVTGEADKIYVDTTDNKTYRWSGTQYVIIGTDLALGETASTAYPGDKGKAAYDNVYALYTGVSKAAIASNADKVNGHTVESDVPADAKFTDTTYSAATTTVDGLMAKEDKVKLDGIEAGANNYVHPSDANTRHVTDEQIAAWNAKGTSEVVTSEINGLMSSSDKVKLDGIEAGANNYVHPSDANTRHVTDQQINNWNNKADKDVATTSINGLMSANDKTKLDSIEAGANNYVHPNDSDTRHVTDDQIVMWNNKASTAAASQFSSGLMSAADKKKLDNIGISYIQTINHTMTFTSTGKIVIPVENIDPTTTIMIGLDYTAITIDEYNAAGLAKFITKIVDGGVEVSCFGTIPTINIPVVLSVVR